MGLLQGHNTKLEQGAKWGPASGLAAVVAAGPTAGRAVDVSAGLSAGRFVELPAGCSARFPTDRSTVLSKDMAAAPAGVNDKGFPRIVDGSYLLQVFSRYVPWVFPRQRITGLSAVFAAVLASGLVVALVLGLTVGLTVGFVGNITLYLGVGLAFGFDVYNIVDLVVGTTVAQRWYSRWHVLRETVTPRHSEAYGETMRAEYSRHCRDHYRSHYHDKLIVCASVPTSKQCRWDLRAKQPLTHTTLYIL